MSFEGSIIALEKNSCCLPRLSNLPSVSGMVPSKQLLNNETSSRLESLPKPEDIVPEK